MGGVEPDLHRFQGDADLAQPSNGRHGTDACQ